MSFWQMSTTRNSYSLIFSTLKPKLFNLKKEIKVI